MSTVAEMYERLEHAVEDGRGDLHCFAVDGSSNTSFEISPGGARTYDGEVGGGPLLDEPRGREYFRFYMGGIMNIETEIGFIQELNKADIEELLLLREEVKELRRRDEHLRRLEEAGVDNWDH